MVRGVPIRLIHVYYEVTFYRRTFTTNRSYKIARKNHTRNDRFRDLTFPSCILGDRHDFNSSLTFFPPRSVVAPTTFVPPNRSVLNIFASPIEINDPAARVIIVAKNIDGKISGKQEFNLRLYRNDLT